MACNKPIKAMNIQEFDIFNLEQLPTYILAEDDVTDPATGDTLSQLVRVPSAKLFPNGNLDNIFALETNNPNITVPEAQVRACRMTAVGGTGIMEYADATHDAQFLAIGDQAGQMLCISTGVLNIPNHQYILAANYYAGANGVPTTDSSSGKLLFTVISRNKILVRL